MASVTLAGFAYGETETGAGTPGAIAGALTEVLRRALPLTLRLLVELNPVVLAPEAGGVNVGGVLKDASAGRSNF